MAKIVAYYEDDAGEGAAGAASILRHAEATLAPYMLPSVIIGLLSLPRLPNDKVNVKQLAGMDPDSPPVGSSVARPGEHGGASGGRQRRRQGRRRRCSGRLPRTGIRLRV
mmetsp:Transcript_37108/g.91711  ORF Transcript_37108/g.91711 Transcript_37108/m.91711 type:complete len:110 (+) Transcript_37108:627-956(+)